MEPQTNSNTTTNAKKSQTLILTEDGDDMTPVFSQLSAEVWVSLSKGCEEVNKHGVGLLPAYKQEN